MLGVASAQAAERASFDCTKAATATEKTICANGALARLDRSIAAAFHQLKAELASVGDALAQEQTQFLAQRDACGANAGCLKAQMEERHAALALAPGHRDPRDVFIGRYRNRYGWMILRRTLQREYSLEGQTGDPAGARWACDISGQVVAIRDGVATVEAGEEKDSHPVQLKLKGGTLIVVEDPDRRLAGYTCGANGFVEGEYRRVSRITP